MKKEILSLRHINLSEKGNEELREVSFSVYEGDILGLISLDNQGLDSLIGLLTDSQRLARGRFPFADSEFSGRITCGTGGVRAAVIESRSRLFPALNIADTFFFAKKRGPALVNRKKQNRQIRLIFEPYGLPLTGKEFPDSLSALERCLVEIIKAKTLGCRLILVREPSSFLGPKEVRRVQELIKRIAADGEIAFVYLCNHHRETLSVCTRLLMMRGGTVMFDKAASTITEEMMAFSSDDFFKSLASLRRPVSPAAAKTAAEIRDGGFSLSVIRGECLVLLDLDNREIQRITDALSGSGEPDCRIVVGGTEARRCRERWAYIPANPVSNTLFFDMSYIDNLTLKNSSRKLPRFWLRKRFASHVAAEFRNQAGDCVDSPNLFSLSRRELYELIYRRAALEKPDVVFIAQPFSRLGMYQRMRVLEHIAELRRSGITVVILAISLSDSLQVATRLVLLQNHKIEKEFLPEDFDLAAAYGLVVR